MTFKNPAPSKQMHELSFLSKVNIEVIFVQFMKDSERTEDKLIGVKRVWKLANRREQALAQGCQGLLDCLETHLCLLFLTFSG